MPRDNEIQKAIKEQAKVTRLVIDNTKDRSAKRPTAPKTLNKEEKEIWKETVANKSPEFFSEETLPSLYQYCKHVASMNRFYKMRDDFYSYYSDGDIATDKETLANLDKIQLLINREAKAAATISKDLSLMAKPEPAAKDDEIEMKSPFPRGV